MALPPGPRAPAVVNTLRLVRDPIATLRGWHARYGDAFSVRYLRFDTGVYVSDPAEIKGLFTGDQSDLLAGEANSPLAPLLGPDSLLTLDGEPHMRQRRLLLPSFSGASVSGFRTVIREVAEAEIGGRRAGDLEQRSDVLSLMLAARDEQGRPMSDSELRDELITMLAAGHETTATGLAFAFDLLIRNPAVLARLREEIAGDDGDSYLDAVVSETLRLRPVIDAAERTLTSPRTICGYEIPAGVRVYPATLIVHSRADLYPEPERFLPERFLGDGVESYSWLPFGGGIRRCIGASLAQAEMAEVLRIAFRRVELEAVHPESDPVVMRGITLTPKHGTEVRVRRVRAGSGSTRARAVPA